MSSLPTDGYDSGHQVGYSQESGLLQGSSQSIYYSKHEHEFQRPMQHPTPAAESKKGNYNSIFMQLVILPYKIKINVCTLMHAYMHF